MEKPTRFSLDDTKNLDLDPKKGRKHFNPATTTHNAIEFTYGRLTRIIQDRGLKVKWEKAYLCVCRSKTTGAPDPSCKYCHGRGIAYLEPEDTVIAIQKQERDEQNAYFGTYSGGTAVGTTLPNSIVTFRDRITVPEVILGQSIVFDVNNHRMSNGFWLPYDVKEVTLAVTEGNTLLHEGEDYTLDSKSNILYPSEHLDKKNISLNVNTILRYIVTDLLKESRYQYSDYGNYAEESDGRIFDDLPRKLLLQREDTWVNHAPMSGESPKGEETNVFVDDTEVKDKASFSGFFGG